MTKWILEITFPLRLLFVPPAFPQDSVWSSHTLTYMSFLSILVKRITKKIDFIEGLLFALSGNNHFLIPKTPNLLCLAVYYYCSLSCDLGSNTMMTQCSSNSVKNFSFSALGGVGWGGAGLGWHKVTQTFCPPLKNGTHIPRAWDLGMEWCCVEIISPLMWVIKC